MYSTDADEQGSFAPWHRPRRLPVPTDRTVVQDGVQVQYFRVGWPTRLSCSWDMAAALRQTVQSFDVVHIHSMYLFHGAVAAHYCRAAGVPYVIRPHGTLNPWHRQRRRWQKALFTRLVEGRNVGGAAAMHYTTPDEARFAQDGGVTAPGFVVGMGVDTEQFAVLPERGQFVAEHPELAGRTLVVFLGRITPKKGFDLLIPAIARIATVVPDVHLVLAGPDEEGYAAHVRELIQQHGIESRVTWTGMVTGAAKIALLRDADVWALPSYDENFAVAAVEAMAAEAPILISTGVGIHEIVRRANAGLVVEPTVYAVRDGLKRLLLDPRLRRDMARRGRELALTELSWDPAARRLIDVYDDIIRNGRSASVLMAPAIS